MYPYILESCVFPMGHPETFEAPTVEDYNNNNWFGFIQCKVTPPPYLGFGVLPTRHNQKMVTPLCNVCMIELSDQPRYLQCKHLNDHRSLSGTWTTVEVDEAVKMGYQIEEIYCVQHYPLQSDSVFKTYIKVFENTLWQ